MALTITQGPLPTDGQSVDPATFLEAWISGTVITDLDATNFDTTEFGVSFVLSQTDPPATSVRNDGLFWFERGAGKMWIWDVLNAPSQLSIAGKDVRFRNSNGRDWICITGGKEIWLHAARGPIPKGAVCYINRFSQNWTTTYVDNNFPFLASENERRGHAPHPGRMYWMVTDQPGGGSGTADITPVCWIALETGASGALFRGKEFGWADMLAHAGETGAAMPCYVTDSGASESAFLRAGAWITQSTNPGRMFIGAFTDSSATNPTDVWLRSGFKQHFPPWAIARERV